MLNPGVVSNVHDRYILLLKHYLEAKHGFSGGRVQLASVLTNLTELQCITENHGSVLMQLEPSKVDPLILEVFNFTVKSSFMSISHAPQQMAVAPAGVSTQGSSFD
ncbi:unnamed protein product [Protopolystoma xenopodis]|uniref:NR LBD domain-containing protein n=1 Tax=Protopolystoma xenopodis TaxID=117903 RepID=A0A448XDE8_9PLAT|nr:unnamed protein product [Protopolystoma xenopodis]